MKVIITWEVHLHLEAVDDSLGEVVPKREALGTVGHEGERPWKDTRPPMPKHFHNRHQEYVASGACPSEWYGVL